ncbi:hypothetical protein ILYODFUR_016428, partial [Ilyodon furcidens]
MWCAFSNLTETNSWAVLLLRVKPEVDRAIRKNNNSEPMTVWDNSDLQTFCDLKSLIFPLFSGSTIIFPAGMMDEVVSAHVHYNAHHLFFSAALSALQEMPEQYWTHEEKRSLPYDFMGEFAARCVKSAHSNPSITNKDTFRLQLALKRSTLCFWCEQSLITIVSL